MKKLLDKGADVNAKGFKNDVSPLKMAVLHRRGEIVKVLLANGADPNQTCSAEATALHTSVSREGMEEDNIIGTFIFKQLLDKGAEVNVKDLEDVTPLHMAARYGKTVEVNYLIRHGAEIDPVNTFG